MKLRDAISLKIGINFSELLLKDINVESDRIADEILELINTEHEELKCLRIRTVWLTDMQRMRDEAIERVVQLNKLLDTKMAECKVKQAIIANLEQDIVDLLNDLRGNNDRNQ